MHIHFIGSRAVVDPRLLVKALNSTRFSSAVTPAIEDNGNPYA